MEDEFVALKEYLKGRGFDCRFYRDPYIQRRLNLRLSATKTRTYGDYRAFIEKNPAEYQKLVDCLAVNVTSFFRDEEPFQVFSAVILPDLLREKQKKGNSVIHVWSSACSSGQEPYSIAMTARETISAELDKGFELKITATDIDIQALKQAEEGAYKEKAMEGLSEKLRRRYFKIKGDVYHVRDVIRDMVTFRTRDLIQDSPVGGVDVIFCRNMLIYIHLNHQKTIFEKFYEALNPGGYLVLGKTEIIPDGLQSKFITVDQPQRVYKKEACV